jgi:hypothetical protein
MERVTMEARLFAGERQKTLGRALIPILGLVALCLAFRPVFALDPLPLPAGGASRHWDGPQFVAADRLGRVSLLRARTLQVYPVEKTGALGEPERLQATLDVSGEVQNAALDASGSQWLIQTFGAVHLFADGKEKALPRLAWLPNSVGFRRDEPVVAVLPVVVGTRQGKLGDTPPWLLRPSGEQWESLREMKGLTAGQTAEGLKNGKLNDYVAKWGAWLAGDRSGRLWVGRSYAYRVERFSPGGRQLLALTVAGGVREPVKSSPQEITVKAGGRDATAPGKDAEEKRSYFGFTAEPAILALTEAPDGRIYLLARNKDGACVLDRLDPTLNQLERVSLSIQLKGRATIAAGKDALYVVAYNGHEGRWRIPWLSMEQAVWKKLKITQEAREEGPTED